MYSNRLWRPIISKSGFKEQTITPHSIFLKHKNHGCVQKGRCFKHHFFWTLPSLNCLIYFRCNFTDFLPKVACEQWAIIAACSPIFYNAPPSSIFSIQNLRLSKQKFFSKLLEIALWYIFANWENGTYLFYLIRQYRAVPAQFNPGPPAVNELMCDGISVWGWALLMKKYLRFKRLC